jgi:uncharacterized protein (TIGR02757 family)
MHLKTILHNLATKFEVASFLYDDPSQFLHYYSNIKDTECAAFIAAMLSFGNRKQFIPKISQILHIADVKSGSISKWLENEDYLSFEYDITQEKQCSQKKFYRFYSYEDMVILFSELNFLLKKYGSFGQAIKHRYEKAEKLNNEISIQFQNSSLNYEPHLSEIISQSFPKSRIVAKGKNSACKRTNMFLRWMVRQNSPVDLGIWTWYSPKNLIIPLDTHVLQQAKKLNLLPQSATACFKTAILLTEKLSYYFPDDPVKGDFALFGLGVSE